MTELESFSEDIEIAEVEKKGTFRRGSATPSLKGRAKRHGHTPFLISASVPIVRPFSEVHLTGHAKVHWHIASFFSVYSLRL